MSFDRSLTYLLVKQCDLEKASGLQMEGFDFYRPGLLLGLVVDGLVSACPWRTEWNVAMKLRELEQVFSKNISHPDYQHRLVAQFRVIIVLTRSRYIKVVD